ncbi:DsbA family protein [Haladaptatus salinisoli]|uniref:DsbA family protein n=1 Tax=Haladaptatus salinisoli TaxID=2884876 RepID=UPI001D0BD42F|nr:thioredoxin domain-containing protein [Haladaptatus salinisoli]
MNRRTLLRTAVPAGLLLAGCTSQSDKSDTTRSTHTSTSQPTESTTTPTTETTIEQKTSRTSQQQTEQTTTTSEETTTTTQSAPDHPTTTGIFDEPTRGPTPFSANATLIAFEDPSCPTCVHFEKNTYPKLKRNHIDSGELSFVLRTIPVVDQWGASAIYALEATHIRDEEAFWDLKSYYFDNQSQFNSDNIFSKTKAFLEQETQVRGEEIIHDAQSKAQKKQVKEDYAAAKDANLKGTPTFVAFRSNEYVTKIVGRQSYSVFKNMLGL